MAYEDIQCLPRRTAAAKAFNIAENAKYDEYQQGLASMVYKFFDKKTSGGANKNEIMSNQELAEKLRKPIIRKFEKRKVYSSFKDNIWNADLVDMPLISKFKKGFRFLLCVISSYIKYAWVVPLKDKNGITITNDFQNFLNKSGRKPNKI